jgi:hypothetical protein
MNFVRGVVNGYFADETGLVPVGIRSPLTVDECSRKVLSVVKVRATS